MPRAEEDGCWRGCAPVGVCVAAHSLWRRKCCVSGAKALGGTYGTMFRTEKMAPAGQ